MAETRIFSGKRYRLHGSYAKKSDAQRKATGFRLGGEPARVVKEGSYWVVYVGKERAKRKRKRKSGRVEAYTYGEAQRTKDWPFGSSRLGQ